MSKEIFSDREKAFEFEFFHKVDQKLLERLREQLDEDEERQSLKKATGINDPEVLDNLLDLGLNAESVVALSLYPLVLVAWSDGELESRERAAIMDAAAEVCHGVDGAAYHLLESWLDEPPSERLFDLWIEFMHAVARSLTSESYESLRLGVVNRARSIAQAAGGFLGIQRVSRAEEIVIERLNKALQA